MQVKLTVDKTNESYEVEVVQRNKNPGLFKPLCEYDENINIILVSVPSCISDVSCQFKSEDWNNLVNSYVSSINKAVSLNKKNVLIPELGENLLWKNVLIIKAAKESLEKCFNNCPDNFRVIFCVDKDKYKLWDEVMKF